MDEICDEGYIVLRLCRIIITTDPSIIMARALMRDCDGINLEKQEAAGGGGFSAVFASAKRSFAT